MLGVIGCFARPTLPQDWLACDGSILNIVDYPALASIIGNSFGGDGITTFGLPDVQGRLPIGSGSGVGLTPRVLADLGGVEDHQLIVDELPVHNHFLRGTSSVATSSSPDNRQIATTIPSIYTDDANNATLNVSSVQSTGGDQPHNNMATFVVLKYGIYTGGDFIVPFTGQISPYVSNSNPADWLSCDGSVLNIGDYPALASVLGTTFGGDGITTFGLPDMQGRASADSQFLSLGDPSGTETVSLDNSQTGHNHLLLATSDSADTDNPSGNYLATANFLAYRDFSTISQLRSDAISNTGSGQPHENMQPFIVFNFVIYAGS
jgi:microcystin-dependent protein